MVKYLRDNSCDVRSLSSLDLSNKQTMEQAHSLISTGILIAYRELIESPSSSGTIIRIGESGKLTKDKISNNTALSRALPPKIVAKLNNSKNRERTKERRGEKGKTRVDFNETGAKKKAMRSNKDK